jgi:hypothetical protein
MRAANRASLFVDEPKSSFAAAFRARMLTATVETIYWQAGDVLENLRHAPLTQRANFLLV